MTAPRRRAGVLTFLIGAAAGLGGARLFSPRKSPVLDTVDFDTGRGAPAEVPSGAAMTAGYEPEDASARGIFRIMALFAGSALTAIALMIFVLHMFHRRDAAREAGLTTIQRVQTLPPEPRVQADPIGDIAGLRRREYKLLHSTERLDAATARIPIDRAMAMMIGQPLDRADTQGTGK